MFISAMILSTLAYAATAQKPAPKPAPLKDWKVEACVASTSMTDKTGTYHLEIAIDQTLTAPLEVRIVPSIALPAGAKLALDKKTTYVFAAASDNSLWNIPRGTLNLLTFLKREAKADVLTGAKTKVSFSLKGSSAALDQLKKECNGAKDLESDGFERAFLPAVVANVDPSLLKPTDVDHLRDLLKAALAAWRSSADTQTALNALSAQFLAQINEFEQLHRNLDKLTHDTVVALQKRHDEATANIAQAQTEIPQLQAQVTQQEAALQPANVALDKAKADLAPLEPQLTRYQNAVDDADSVVSGRSSDLRAAQSYESQTRTRLAQTIDGVNQSAANINAIQNEIVQLRSDLNNANNYASQMQNYWSDQSSARQRFNQGSEIQRRLSSDSRLSSIDSQLRDSQNRVPGAQQHMNDAIADRQNFLSQLAACQADPAKDCTNERNLVARADQRQLQARNEFDGLMNRIRDLQNQHDNFRSVIEGEVRRDYDVLVGNEQDAQTKYNQARSDAQSVANQLNQAQGPDLQAAQSNLASWQNARSQADSDVRGAQNGTAIAQRNLSLAQSDENDAESRRDSWMQSSGYNARSNTLDKAQALVDRINSTLTTLDRQITSRQKLIRDETAALAANEAAMKDAVATIAAKEARSVEVQKMLEPYFTQRDALTVQKASADQAFKNAQVEFASVLTPVAPPLAVVVAK